MTSIGTHADGRPFGMPRKAYAVFMDRQRWKDFVAEYGGEDECMGWVCAQVASGVSLKVLSEHYVVDYGLLWEFVSGDIERYELAQRGVAEYWVSESVGIADDADPEAVPHAKLKIDTRMKVAARWNRSKYGEVAQTQINVGANSLVAILSGLPSAQVEAERQEKIAERLEAAPELVEGVPIEDAQIIPMKIIDEDSRMDDAVAEVIRNIPEKIPAENPEIIEPAPEKQGALADADADADPAEQMYI